MKRILTALACAFTMACNAQMTAARMMAFAQTGGALSAKSYVQDGLVAMWDGIENAGWGVHDPDATVWKDLVGGVSYSIIGGTYEWRNNAFVPTYGSSRMVDVEIQNITSAIASKRFTVEAVTGMGTGGNGYQSQIINITEKTTDGYSVGFLKFYRIETTGIISPVVGTTYGLAPSYTAGQGLVKLSLAVDQDEIYQAINEDVKTGTVSHEPFLSSVVRIPSRQYGFQGLCHCYRFYNRALTPAEISANYAVDKARFNLP